VSLDEFDGVRLGLVCAPRHQTISRYTGSRRIPSVIGGPGADFIAAQMAPMGASRTEKRDIPSGEAADVSTGDLHNFFAESAFWKIGTAALT